MSTALDQSQSSSWFVAQAAQFTHRCRCHWFCAVCIVNDEPSLIATYQQDSMYALLVWDYVHQSMKVVFLHAWRTLSTVCCWTRTEALRFHRLMFSTRVNLLWAMQHSFIAWFVVEAQLVCFATWMNRFAIWNAISTIAASRTLVYLQSANVSRKATRIRPPRRLNQSEGWKSTTNTCAEWTQLRRKSAKCHRWLFTVIWAFWNFQVAFYCWEGAIKVCAKFLCYLQKVQKSDFIKVCVIDRVLAVIYTPSDCLNFFQAFEMMIVYQLGITPLMGSRYY